MVFTYLPRDLVIPYLDLEPKVVYKTKSIWASLKNEKSLFYKIWSDSEKGIACRQQTSTLVPAKRGAGSGAAVDWDRTGPHQHGPWLCTLNRGSTCFPE